MTRPGPDYPHKRPRQTANSDVGAPPQAGASIVIPIRLQVTGPTLAAIEEFKQEVTTRLKDDLTNSRKPIFGSRLHHGITVHQVQIGDS